MKNLHVSEPDIGSTFYFNILLSKPRIENSDWVNEIIGGQLLDKQELLNEKKCVLIAEDNEINQKIVSAYLSKKNYKYICVSNGKQAVEEFKTNNVDLVLMDIQMPEMNGIEATRRIREMEQSSEKRVNIIAMTAYAMKNDIDVCRKAGMDDFITKPIDLELFYNKVEKFI